MILQLKETACYFNGHSVVPLVVAKPSLWMMSAVLKDFLESNSAGKNYVTLSLARLRSLTEKD